MKWTVATMLSLAATALTSGGFMKFDLHREPVRRSKLARRQAGFLEEGIDLALDNTAYWLNLSIGTPPQPFRLQLDTGSSDLWIPAGNATACISQDDGCPGGGFNINSSSTASVTSFGTFGISYFDGTGDYGDYFTDVITVGDQIIDAGTMQMGLAFDTEDGPSFSNDGHGLVGVGYACLQAGIGNEVFDSSDLPPSFPLALAQSGAIDRASYSLYLGDRDSGLGSVIFGGVDSGKYDGELVSTAIVPTPENNCSDYNRFSIALTGISFTDNSGTHMLTDETFGVPATIDSGATFSDLPPEVWNNVMAGIGATVDGGDAGVPCVYAQAEATLNFQFGGPDGPFINVSLSELMLPHTQFAFDDGTDMCQVALSSAGEKGITLGDSFMRSGYFVYDLENNYLALAQAAVDAADSDASAITPISIGTTIPGATSTIDFIDVTSLVVPDTPETSAATTQGTASTLPLSPTFDLGSVTNLIGPSSTDASETGTTRINPGASGTSTSTSSEGSSTSSSSSGSHTNKVLAGLMMFCSTVVVVATLL